MKRTRRAVEEQHQRHEQSNQQRAAKNSKKTHLFFMEGWLSFVPHDFNL